MNILSARFVPKEKLKIKEKSFTLKIINQGILLNRGSVHNSFMTLE
jgi:hypothetical protein